MADGDAFARGSARLKPAIYDTDSLPADRQFAAWRDRCGSVVQLTATKDAAEGYRARNTLWTLGSMALSHVTVGASGFARPRSMIRRDGLDHWVLGYLRRGTLHHRAGTTEFAIRPGEIFHTSLGEEMEGLRSDGEWLALFIPRDAMGDLGPVMEASRNAPIMTPMAGLLRDYLDSLQARLPMMTEAEIPTLVETTRAMIGACIGSAARDDDASLAQLDTSRLDRIRRIVQANLRSSTFGPKKLCRLAGISRSHVYRLFQASGGVARYIQQQRLIAAHAALADPDSRLTIAAIAEELGFVDPSSFSRAFRDAFGYRPSDARSAGPLRQARFLARGRVAMPDGADFGGLLRQLTR